jgi:N-acetylglucosamine kinase-like BadF-type ATPase
MEAWLVAATQSLMTSLRLIIDGGGTSTAVAVFDGTVERARVSLPPYRPTSDSLQTDALCHHLATWLTATAIPSEAIRSVIVGMAGVWSAEEKRVYAEALRSDWETHLGIAAPHAVVLADIELVQVAALRGRSGIILIAGTGSMALGVTTNGHAVRCGGWGPRIDDAGGGFWIGREALRAVARMIDGTGPSTHLIRPVAAWLRVDSQDLTAVANRLRSASIDGVSRLAPAVFTYAEEGDASATEIISEAAQALTTLVRTITRHHQEIEPLVVRYGSLWKAQLLVGSVERQILAGHDAMAFESVDDVLAAANAVLHGGI